MTNQVSVSVIICTYAEARWDQLVDAVKSVQQQTLRPHEVIVAVDHNPKLLARAREEISDVTVVTNSGSVGLSGTRNCGVAASTGEFVAFMDDDALAHPEWLGHLMECFGSDDVLGVGGSIEPIWPGIRPRWFPEEFLWTLGCTYLGMPRTVAPVRNLIGCSMSFRRRIFEEVGGFSHGIGRIGSSPVGCEETEFCIRALQHWPGRKILHAPQARTSHMVAKERVSLRYFCSRCYREGRSKAIVAWIAGSRNGLANEREYALRTLPAGFLRGLLEGIGTGDSHGLARSGTILIGLTVTVAGYLIGTLSESFKGARQGKLTKR